MSLRLRTLSVSILVAMLAAGPALAQKQSLADRVGRLEQQSLTQTSSSGQANVELLNRMTQVQTELQALRNQVEQLQNENEQLKQRNREQNIDFDTRLERLEGGASAGSVVAGAAPTGPRVGAPVRTGPAQAGLAPRSDTAVASGSEQAAYATAFDALKRGEYVESARGFQAYLSAYPQGALAPNALYWLGESYYVTQNYPIALQSFQRLISEFPGSPKAPDALLKVGYSQIELNQTGTGQATLDRVISDYPGTEAARLAASRLRALSLESR